MSEDRIRVKHIVTTIRCIFDFFTSFSLILFYIVEESSDSTTTVEGTNKKNYGDDDTLQNLQMFIDDKLQELIINKIKLEVKNALSQELNILHQSNELKVINVPQSIDSNKDDSVNIPQRIDYTNDAFVKSLHDEISFLRKEVESKDTIIKILLNERSTTVNATVNTDNTTNLRLNKNKNNAKSNVRMTMSTKTTLMMKPKKTSLLK